MLLADPGGFCYRVTEAGLGRHCNVLSNVDLLLKIVKSVKMHRQKLNQTFSINPLFTALGVSWPDLLAASVREMDGWGRQVPEIASSYSSSY